jgi:translation initiation factor 5A
MHMEFEKNTVEVRSLKKNGYILIDDEPSRILSITTSKPGKHGEAKARIEAMWLFDDQKRSIVHPVKHKVQVPVVDKRQGQVIALMGKSAQIMDMETYETFELPIPEEGRLEPGREIQYIVSMGHRKITRT